MKLNSKWSAALIVLAVVLIVNGVYMIYMQSLTTPVDDGWGRYGSYLGAIINLVIASAALFFTYDSYHKNNRKDALSRERQKVDDAIAAKDRRHKDAELLVARYRASANQFSNSGGHGVECFKEFRLDLLKSMEEFFSSVNGHIPEKVRNQYARRADEALSNQYKHAAGFIEVTLDVMSKLDSLQRESDQQESHIEALVLTMTQDEILLLLCWYISLKSSSEGRELIRAHNIFKSHTMRIPNADAVYLSQSIDVMREMAGVKP